MDVLALGGTIAMVPPSGRAGDGVVPQLSAEDLVAAVPGLAELAQVGAVSVRALPGASLSFRDLAEVARIAVDCVDAGAIGIVVTQGTDSLEEAAYVLDLLWERPEPLVMTGAMRPATAPGTDGPGNVWAATAVAVAPAARGRGCLAVFGDEIFRARDVAKVHSTRPSAFAAPATGPVGQVTEGVARFTSAPRPWARALVPAAGPPPRIALVTAVLGDHGEQLRGTITGAFDGVVVAAMGAGHVPQGMLPAIAEVVEQVPVAVASRTNAGPLLRNTYAFPGSERDLHRLGLLDADGLGPLKARVLLALALWSAGDRLAAEELFRARAALRD